MAAEEKRRKDKRRKDNMAGDRQSSSSGLPTKAAGSSNAGGARGRVGADAGKGVATPQENRGGRGKQRKRAASSDSEAVESSKRTSASGGSSKTNTPRASSASSHSRDDRVVSMKDVHKAIVHVGGEYLADNMWTHVLEFLEDEGAVREEGKDN
jgi:hypothetical protein